MRNTPHNPVTEGAIRFGNVVVCYGALMLGSMARFGDFYERMLVGNKHEPLPDVLATDIVAERCWARATRGIPSPFRG